MTTLARQGANRVQQVPKFPAMPGVQTTRGNCDGEYS
jgi:hypothetical protein